MKWFKHETNSLTEGAKLKKLVMKFGTDGYAVYYHCLELIAGMISSENITFELEHDAEIIADNLRVKGDESHTPSEKVSVIMRYMIDNNLFSENGGRIFCLSMVRQIDAALVRNPELQRIKQYIKEHSGQFGIYPDISDQIRSDEKRSDEKKSEEDLFSQNNGEKNTSLPEDVNDVYDAYPEVCPIHRPERKTWKSEEDKGTIHDLLTAGHEKGYLLEKIRKYVENCLGKKLYIKNFSTFLKEISDKKIKGSPPPGKKTDNSEEIARLAIEKMRREGIDV